MAKTVGMGYLKVIAVWAAVAVLGTLCIVALKFSGSLFEYLM